MASVDNILRSVGTMSALPGTVARIIAILNDTESNSKEITEIIRRDEVLSLAVLRAANSVAYGVPGKTFDIRQATVRLGSAVLTQIALSQQMSPLFKCAGSAYGLRRNALWGGALGGAYAAEQLAKVHGFDDSELCFLCGLVRDIGKLAIDAHCGETHATIATTDENRSFLDDERAAIGTDHTEVGAALASRWSLPDRIVDAIRYHHGPPGPTQAEHDRLFDIVHAADVICLWAGLGIGDDGLRYRVAEHVSESLLANREQVEDIISSVSTQIARASEELDVTLGAGEIA